MEESLQTLNEQISRVIDTVSGFSGKSVPLSEIPEAIVDLLDKAVNAYGKCFFNAICFKRAEIMPEKPQGGSWHYDDSQKNFVFNCPIGWKLSVEEVEDAEQFLPVWMSTAIFDSLTDRPTQEWSNPVRISGIGGTNGAPGTPGADGVPGKDGKDGVDGADGRDGIDGNGIYKSVVYRRDNEEPETPKGGNYANPVPEGWSSSIPEVIDGVLRLWMSTRVFTIDGMPPQETEWSTPAEIADALTMIAMYSDEEERPEDPSVDPEKWYTEPGSEDHPVWMAIGYRKGDAEPDTWQIIKIKGADGIDGIDGKDGQDGQDGQDGESSYVYVRYSDILQPQSLEDLSTEPKKYIGLLVTVKTEDELTWEDWSAVIFTKFTGDDGFGYEFVYITSGETPTLLTNQPDSAGRIKEMDGYLPSTIDGVEWSDDPLEAVANIPCWVSQRKKENGVWREFTEPRVWSTVSDEVLLIDTYYAKSEESVPPTYTDVRESALLESGWVKERSEDYTNGFYYFTLTVMRYANPTKDFAMLSTVYYPLDGTPGLITYPAGTYSKFKFYAVTNNSTPYVEHNNQYYYLNPAIPGAEEEAIRPVPGTGDTWIHMDYFDAVITKLLIADNGTIGKFIFSGDYMFSVNGIVHDDDEDLTMTYNDMLKEPAYTADFSWDHRGEPDVWCPNLSINQKTGKIRCANVQLIGNIEATSGRIGEVVIDNGELVTTKDSENTTWSTRIGKGIIKTTATVPLTGTVTTSTLSGGGIKFESGTNTITYGINNISSNHAFNIDNGNTHAIVTSSAITLQQGNMTSAVIGNNAINLKQGSTYAKLENQVLELSTHGNSDPKITLDEESVTLSYGNKYIKIMADGIHMKGTIIND